MTVTITVSNTIDESWAVDPVELAKMSDQELIAMVRDDINSFLQGSVWDVAREK